MGPRMTASAAARDGIPAALDVQVGEHLSDLDDITGRTSIPGDPGVDDRRGVPAVTVAVPRHFG